MSLKDYLIAAKSLLPPDKWARGNGHMIGNVPHDKECALTACHKVGYSHGRYSAMVQALEAQIPPKSRFRALHRYNDNSSYADVMALFDRAIEAAS